MLENYYSLILYRMMEYSGKKLPTGFVYMFSKKDMKEINNAIGNCIETVHLYGTSYFEYKETMNRGRDISVAYIRYFKNELGLTLKIQLYGIRKSHFADQEVFLSQKEKLKIEMIDLINKDIQLYKQNDLISDFQFVSVKINIYL